MTDKTLEAIAEYLQNIRKLEISFCNGLTEPGIVRMLSRCHGIQILALPMQTDSLLEAVASNCPLMQQLVLSRSGNITDQVRL